MTCICVSVLTLANQCRHISSWQTYLWTDAAVNCRMVLASSSMYLSTAILSDVAGLSSILSSRQAWNVAQSIHLKLAWPRTCWRDNLHVRSHNWSRLSRWQTDAHVGQGFWSPESQGQRWQRKGTEPLWGHLVHRSNRRSPCHSHAGSCCSHSRASFHVFYTKISHHLGDKSTTEVLEGDSTWWSAGQVRQAKQEPLTCLPILEVWQSPSGAFDLRPPQHSDLGPCRQDHCVTNLS